MKQANRLAVVVGAGASAVVLGLTGIALSSPASSNDGTSATTIAYLPEVSGSVENVGSPGVSSAIAGSLPGEQKLTSQSNVLGDRISYEEYAFADGSGSSFGVVVYREFDRSELSALKRIPVRSGEAWVGAEDVDLTSVYYYDETVGVGVWVSNSAPEGKAPQPAEALTGVAQQIAADARVQEAAR